MSQTPPETNRTYLLTEDDLRAGPGSLLGALQQMVREVTSDFLVEGSNVTLELDPSGQQLKVSAAGGGTVVIGDGVGAGFTIRDNGDGTFTIVAAGTDPEDPEDPPVVTPPPTGGGSTALPSGTITAGPPPRADDTQLWPGNFQANHTLPSGITAGKLLGVVLVLRPPTAEFPPTLSDNVGGTWTKAVESFGGPSDAFGPDSGQVRAAAYFKVAVGGENTVYVPAATGTYDATTASGLISSHTWAKQTNDAWDTPVAAFGADTTQGTAYAVTSSSSLGAVTGDHLVSIMALNSDVLPTESALTAPGTVLEAGALLQNVATPGGNDSALVVTDYRVASGAQSGPAAVTATMPTPTAGVSLVVKLRTKVGEGTPPATGGGTTTPVPSDPIIDSGTVLKALLAGDSLTAVDQYALGWKGYAYDTLSQKYRLDYVGSQTSTGPAGIKDPQHEGHSGWQNSNFQPVISGYVSTYNPDLMVYLVGTNDIWSNITAATADTRRRDVLTKAYAAKPNLHVLVAKIARMGQGSQSEWASYNAKTDQLVADFKAAGRRISMVDLSGVLAASDLQGDGIHWTTQGHLKIAAAMVPAISAALDSLIRPVPTTPGTVTTAPMGLPKDAVMGFFMMWPDSPEMNVADIYSPVNMVALSFMQGDPPSMVGWGQYEFKRASTEAARRANFIAKAKVLRAAGKRIGVSFGGAGGYINTANRQAMVNSVMALNADLPIDFIDWDIESAAVNPANMAWVSAELTRLRGPDFAITLAPNGSWVQQYLALAAELRKAGVTNYMYGQQFYDAEVSEAAMLGRLKEAVDSGISQRNLSVGMMLEDGNIKRWSLATAKSRMDAALAAYPNIRGAYLWELARPYSSEWATSMAAKLAASGA